MASSNGSYVKKKRQKQENFKNKVHGSKRSSDLHFNSQIYFECLSIHMENLEVKHYKSLANAQY